MTLSDGPAHPPPPGLIIAAPESGSGKTLVTLGLIRHFRNCGMTVGSVKIGPDYIDPAFHAAAGGRACGNLDLWAMREATINYVTADAAAGADMFIAEGVMGLFDGAVQDLGSTADAAARLTLPVILVVDARAQGASAAAVVRGFAAHRPDVMVAGVIFNRTGSDRHREILTDAMAAHLPEIKVLGCLPRMPDLALPNRHLGLVQAREHAGIEDFIDGAAAAVTRHLDTKAISALARPTPVDPTAPNPMGALPPLGQKIAIARDDAFSFIYPHVVDGWRRAGAEISWFSPLADEAPQPDANAVFLPGGYPELHAGRIAGNARFLAGLRDRAAASVTVFGECGGYMVLGQRLIDADGVGYEMAGLLSFETSFADRRLHLGYRRATLVSDGPLGRAGSSLRGHEFHYAVTASEGPGDPLLTLKDAAGRALGPAGLQQGTVMGSFVHLIDHEGTNP
ncbi:MAG: cobyrinate a,c-diamide synthase [Rhodospirillaceae bacterium]